MDSYKLILQNIINEFPCHYKSILKNKYPEILNLINISGKGINLNEKIYNILNPNYNSICSCGKQCNFLTFKKGYSKNCSSKCSNGSITIKSKKSNSFMAKYGVDNPSKSQEIKEKKKSTNLKNYGLDCNFKDESCKDKIRKTNLENYGVEYFTKSMDYKYIAFEKTYNNLLSNEKFSNIIPNFKMEDFRGVEHTYNFKCKTCNTSFDDHLQDGRIPICKICNPIKNSVGQIEICDFIKQFCPDLIVGNRTILSGKELDIYIPSKNIAIEYNGNYYHSEIGGGIGKDYHLNKTLECEKIGIQLIHIFEDEWLNKQEIVKAKLKHILGFNTSKIFARKCEIRPVNSADTAIFINSYHIQGKDTSKIKLGLYYNNELVSIMTFGNLRICMGSVKSDDVYELCRFCSSKNVIGGASKLLAHFKKEYNPNKIITYADRRWSNGNLYRKLEFEFTHFTKPNYWYMKYHTKRYHRFGFRKDKLKEILPVFDSNISEWQNMQINGYDRIWDCGNIKYEWIKSPILQN